MQKINSKRFVFDFLFFGLLLFYNVEVIAQVPSYLNGQITGKKFQSGSLISLGTGSAGISGPILTEAWGCSFGIQTNQFRFYYNTAANFTSAAPAKLTAARYIGVLGLIGAGGDAYIQFRNTGNATIPANKPTYFKLQNKPTTGGISLNLGGVLGLSELQSITGVAYSGASNYTLNTASLNTLCTNSYNGNENTGTIAGSSTTQLLIDKTGTWFAKVTPNVAYNAVRLNVVYPEDKLLLLDLAALANVNATINLDVYSAFTQTDGGTCSLSPQFTSPGEIAGGVTLTTSAVTAGLGINLNELVASPQDAINGNSNDYSSFSSGITGVGVANSIAQNFYFDHKATANDGIQLQLGIQNGLIDLDLLKLTMIKFRAYNGNSSSPVYENNLAAIISLLQLNLLNILTVNGANHKDLDLTFKPGVDFDRFEIIFDQGVASVGVLGEALRIYEVSIAPSLPTVTIQPTNALANQLCEGETASFSVTAAANNGGTISAYQWQYLDVSNNWLNVPSGNTNTLAVANTTYAMNNRWYRAKITGGNTSCPQDIYSNQVQLTVKPRAKASDITAPNVTICEGNATTITASSSISNPSFKWYNNAALTGAPLSTANSLNVNPTTTTSYWVTVEGTATCQNATNTAKQVTITVTPHATPIILVN